MSKAKVKSEETTSELEGMQLRPYKAIATLEARSEVLVRKYHEEPKATGEKPGAYEERTWREGLHFDENDNVVLPTIWFIKSLAEAAKMLSEQVPGKGKATYTKHFTRGIIVASPDIVLPFKKDDLPGKRIYVPADGRAGGSTRVFRHFGCIQYWTGIIEYEVFDPVITHDVFLRTLHAAGAFIGIGAMRRQSGNMNGVYCVKDCKFVD